MAAGVAAALVVAAPAAAHSADAPSATDYRVTVTGVTPPLPGLTVRTIEAGARLELINHTGRDIEVLGYSGEPYLRIGPQGVFQNVNSPATYLNESLNGGVAPPSSASPAMPPGWQRLSSTPAVLWHDHRTQRASGSGPTTMRWSIPLRDGVRVFAVTGTTAWVPPPSTATWWAGCLLLGAAVAALCVLAARRSPPGGKQPAAGSPTVAAHAPLVGHTSLAGHGRSLLTGRPARVLPARWVAALPAAVAVVAGLSGIGYATGAALDAGVLDGGVFGGGVPDVGAFLRVLAGRQTWSVLCAVAALAAGCYALARRPASDLALALGGACLALFSGAANAVVFAHAVAPIPWSGTTARVLILLAIAGGGGLCAGTVIAMRSPSRPAPAGPGVPRPADHEPGSASRTSSASGHISRR